MIKTLQKKFIMTAMAAVTVLLLVLAGGINTAYGLFSSRQSGRQLEMLAETEGRIIHAEKPGPRPKSFLDPPMDEDAAMSLRFFMVRLSEQGTVVYKDVSRISSVSGEEAEAYAKKAAEEEKQTGRIDNFKYRVTADETGKTVLFLDVSGQFRSILLVFVLTVSFAGVCWILMLLFVILLSRRAIRPIAQNIQKQKQFVTDAGHEIKTPLAIIQSNIDAMELINGENKWSRNIRNQTVRLNGLMQNLLTLARMDEQQPALFMETISFDLLLEEVLQSFYEPAALRGICIETDIEQKLHIHADQGSMRQLLSILFDNAVKYTDQNGSISVSLARQGKAAVLRVKNTCRQLPQEDAQRLFDRFYREDSARTQKNGGYGIGLSAAQAITAAHHGSIYAEYADAHTIVFVVKI